jgi:hypothetical protein
MTLQPYLTHPVDNAARTRPHHLRGAATLPTSAPGEALEADLRHDADLRHEADLRDDAGRRHESGS